MMSRRKRVESKIELERSISSNSLTPLLCLLEDEPTKSSIEPKKSCDHAPKLIGSGSSGIWNRFKSWVGSCSLTDLHSHLSVHSPVQFKKKTFTGQQREDEVEREVTMLHKMLSPEEKVKSWEDESAFSILNFLPPKMKEIAVELAIVENEIARLECQIKQLQHHNDDMNIHKNTCGHHRSLKDHFDASPLPPNPHMSRRSNENAATTTLDNKSLHFISKTIKGDYHLTNSSTNVKIDQRKHARRRKSEKKIPNEMAY